jgi:predicted DNA-binding transcriptional regulator AlpA
MSLGRCYIAFLFILVACAIGFTLWYRNKKC